MEQSEIQLQFDKIQKQQKELLWENRIQTLAVILVFIWGINTFKDLTKTIKA